MTEEVERMIRGRLLRVPSIVFLALLLGCSGFVSASVASLQQTPARLSSMIYVDDDNTQGPWDGSLEHPYQHILDAVNLSQENDTIFVFSGSYYEHITIRKSLTILGENRTSTIIDSKGKGCCFILRAGINRISGFTICNSSNYATGLYIGDNSHHNVIRDNIIEDNVNGINLWCPSWNTIDSNIIRKNRDEGICDLGSESLITNNTIIDNGDCGYYGGGSVFSQNYLENNTNMGAYLCRANARIEGNHIERSNKGILAVEYFDMILGNNITGTSLGLMLEQSVYTTVANNTFLNNSLDASFCFSIMDRVRIPFLFSLQLVRWHGNYWHQPRRIQQISGTLMVIETLYGPDIPWNNYDFRPAQHPYPDPVDRGEP